MPNYWLMKSEPTVYSIDDLERDGKTCWEGVRNYRARNYMREMRAGDRVLFYHSNAKPSSVVGLARVVRGAYPDHYARDKRNRYYDPKSSAANPRWFMVDVAFEEKFPSPVSLGQIKSAAKLKEMVLVNNSRLSVQPVTKDEFGVITRMVR